MCEGVFFENTGRYALLYNCCIMVGLLGCFEGVFRGGFVPFFVVLAWFLFYFSETRVCFNSRTVFSHKKLLKSFQNFLKFLSKEKKSKQIHCESKKEVEGLSFKFQ